ncbi:MAG: DUF4352 domain-containing protein [Lachnospiraceae bacterium]|nr:DUF4352 domain-containing protein [Lachnospiraceae bacterium]
MNRRVFRTISCVAISVLLSISMCACSVVPSLQLTEEQSNLIAEFAAGKLLEYAKGHPGGLMSVQEIDRADVNPGMKKEEPEPTLPPLPEPGEEPEAADIQPEDQGEEQPLLDGEQEALVEAPEDVSAVPEKSIAEALGIEGAEVVYDHYDVAATYPPDDTELAFSMKAAPGKQLLVVHFNLSNPGSEEIQAFTDSSGFKIRMLLNGGDRLRADVTFLDNDLMNYQGALTPGALVDAVIVFEIPEGTEVSSMDLLILDGETENKYPLM